MRAVHIVFSTLAVVSAGLAGLLWLGRSAEGAASPTEPAKGALAPFLGDSAAWVEVGRLEGAAGSPVDLAANDSGVVVLFAAEWYWVQGGIVAGGFGDPVPGSPHFLAQPKGVALGKGQVLILEQAGPRVSFWDRAGARLGEIPLPPPPEGFGLPLQVLADGEGNPLVLTLVQLPRGDARWEVGRLSWDASPQGLFSLPASRPSGLFARPFLARSGAHLLALMALDHQLYSVPLEGGRVEQVSQRRDPPLWAVPPRVRARYQSRIGALGGGRLGDLMDLPPYYPSVRDLTVRPDGTLLVAVTVDEDRQHLEVISPQGEPLFRFNREGYTSPLFLDGGKAFVLGETLEGTVIYELIPRGSP